VDAVKLASRLSESFHAKNGLSVAS